MNLNRKTKKYGDKIFQSYSDDIDVYLRSSRTKGAKYDPAYKVAYDKTLQNPLTVKAVTRDKTAESLIINKIGLVGAGSKSIVVQEADVSLFKLAERVVIEEEEYVVYHQALGNRFQVFDAKFGYKTIALYRSGV